MNQTFKNQLTRLVLETRLPWTKCLPMGGHWPLPHEMLYGLPYLSSVTDVPTFETRLFPQKLYTWVVLYLTFS
jgi:hypothetical protein